MLQTSHIPSLDFKLIRIRLRTLLLRITTFKLLICSNLWTSKKQLAIFKSLFLSQDVPALDAIIMPHKILKSINWDWYRSNTNWIKNLKEITKALRSTKYIASGSVPTEERQVALIKLLETMTIRTISLSYWKRRRLLPQALNLEGRKILLWGAHAPKDLLTTPQTPLQEIKSTKY
jgi:hypothetical protein